MSQWDAWVGRKIEQHDQLTRALLTRFRATIDSGESGDSGPQAIHWCLCLPETPTSALAIDGHPQRHDDDGGILPPLALPRRMWAASRVEFHRPLCAGDRISRHSILRSISEKTGRTGQLAFAEIDHDTRVDGQLAVHERQTLVYREAAPTGTKAADTPSVPAVPKAEAWDWHRCVTASEAMLFRYSALTFNSHRIHYDAPYARQEEGYRALVVHGPLIATLLLDLAQRNLGSNALSHFSMRAQAPAYVGEPLHLYGKKTGEAVILVALGGDGRNIMSADAATRSDGF